MHLDNVIFILFLLISLLAGIRGAIQHPTIQATRFTTAHIIAVILAITYGRRGIV